MCTSWYLKVLVCGVRPALFGAMSERPRCRTANPARLVRLQLAPPREIRCGRTQIARARIVTPLASGSITHRSPLISCNARMLKR